MLIAIPPLAHALAGLALAYAALGLAVAAAFLAYGIGRVDPAARGSYAFRPLLLPGVVLLWPLVVGLWARRAWPGRAG